MMTAPLPLVLPHDVIEPAPIGWWPLAPGWWLVIVVTAISAALAIRWLLRRRQAQAPLRQALREHAQIHAHWQQQRDHRAATAALSALLKRTARWRYPTHDTAALSGARWQQFLLQSGAGAFSDEAARQLSQFYQAPTSADTAPPFDACARWLRAQLRPQTLPQVSHD